MIGSERIVHPSERSRMPCSSERQERPAETADDPPAAPPPHDDESRIHEIAEEYLDQLIGGLEPDRSGLLRRHPKIAVELDRRLSLMDLLFRARPGGS